MSLKINLRHLEAHEIHLKGELPIVELELDLHDEMIRAEKPLHYDLEVEQLHDAILVQGKLELTLKCECVRCLKPFDQKLKIDHWTLHLPLEGDEKITIDGDFIDLTPFVREDILLEFPQHPLCKPDCKGLNKKARKSSEQKPDVWAELNKLKL